MSEPENPILVLRVFGAANVRRNDGGALLLPGTRPMALLALLATGPEMTRSRAWLIDRLWSSSDAVRGRANLRQLLHDMRQRMGPLFDAVVDVDGDRIVLRPKSVALKGGPEDGEFLEGFDLPQEGFEDWLRDQRTSESPALRQQQAALPSHLPRIAVMPFAEMGTPEAAGIGDCLAHEITSVFARSKLADAISHFSARSIGVKAQPTTHIASELQPDYVVQGHVRMLGQKITLDATLTDVAQSKVIYSDRYQFDLLAFLAGDDAAATSVAGQVLRQVMARSIDMSTHKPVPELAAHELMMSGVGLLHAFDKGHFERAHAQLKQVIERCPGHSEPRAWLAQWYLLRIYQKWSSDTAQDHASARAAIGEALDRNPICPLALAFDANILTVLDRNFELAEQRFAAARAINPSSALISHLESVLATFAGDGARAVALADRGQVLSPRDPRQPFFMTLRAGSYVAGGRYEKAVSLSEESIRHRPNHLSAHRCRVIALQMGGRAAEARTAARQLLKLDPDLTVATYLKQNPAGQTDAGRQWGAALAEAGVPAT